MFFSTPTRTWIIRIYFFTRKYSPFLRKSILSPKCIFPFLQSLSPGVNLRLYHHSTETETHIYFIPKMAKSFDLLGFSRQKTDCFNMPCMTKLVKCLPLHQLILLLTKDFQIPCQRCRIAAYINYPLRFHL